MTFGTRRFRTLLFVSCASLVETNLLDCTDTMIIGHLLGDAALGALGLFWPCLEFICFIATTVAGGIAITFSEAIGVFNQDRATKAFSSGLFAIVAVGSVLACAMFFACDRCCTFLGAGPETIRYLRPYWQVFSVNALLLPASIYLATMVCADGDGKVCTAAFVSELLVNAVASYFLCRKYGAAGCALGTVAGTVASLAILPVHFLRRDNTLRLRPVFSFAEIVIAARTDFSESSDMLFTGLLYVFMNRLLVRNFGEGALTVMAAVIMANSFTYFLYGVAKAAQPIVGVYLGERNYPAVRSVMRDAYLWSIALGAAASAVLIAFPGLPVALAGVDAPDLAMRSARAIRIVAAGYLAVGVTALSVSYLIFIGRTKLSLSLAFLQGAVCPVIGCLAGASLGGESGFWLGYMLATPAALAAVCVYLFTHGEGKLLPFLLPRERDGRIRTWYVRRMDDARSCQIAQEVMATLKGASAEPKHIVRAAMIVEDTLVEIRQRNTGSDVSAEVTLDANDGIVLRFRDNGVIDSGDLAESNDEFRNRMLAKLRGSASACLVTTGFNRREVVL